MPTDVGERRDARLTSFVGVDVQSVIRVAGLDSLDHDLHGRAAGVALEPDRADPHSRCVAEHRPRRPAVAGRRIGRRQGDQQPAERYRARRASGELGPSVLTR